MIVFSTTSPPSSFSQQFRLLPALLLLMAAAFGLALLWPPLVLLVPVLLGLGLAIARSCDWAIWIVLFVIYSNVAVIAVKFHGLPSAVAMAVPGLLGISLLSYVLIHKKPLVLGPSLPWMIALAVVQLLGTVFARRPQVAWINYMTFLQEGLCLYILITNVVRHPKALRGGIRALLLAGCLMGGVPLLQQLTGTFDNNYGGLAQVHGPGFTTSEHTPVGEVTQKRLAGPIGEKNRYAQIMLMLVPLGLYRIRGEWTRTGKLFAIVATVLAVAGTVLAFSRGAVVAAGLTILFAAWRRYLPRTQTFLAIGIMLAVLLLTPQYRARLASLTDIGALMTSGKHASAGGALKGRATEMGAAILVFLDHPAVGVGPGMFKHYAQEYGERIGIRALEGERQAHSLLLGVAAEQGLLGLTILVVIFLATARNLMQIRARSIGTNRERSDTATAFLLVMVVYFTTGLFLHFAYIRYFWMMLALADSAVLIFSYPAVVHGLSRHAP